MPKGSKIEDKSDKSTPILSGKVANSKIKVQVVGYSSATNFNRSMESTLTMLKSYGAKKINPVVRTDGQMYSVVLTSSDKPDVAGILFYPLNSYLATMIILKSENDKPIDVKKLDIGRVSKSYRFKKTDKVKDYKECKAYPSVFDNMMAGMIEFPHEYQWDKKDQTYKSADGLTKIQINQNPVFMGMDEYDKNSTKSLEQTGAKILKRTDTKILKQPGRILSGTAGKQYFSSVIYNYAGAWYSWTVTSDSKDKSDKLMKYITDNMTDLNTVLPRNMKLRR